jgi:hypothetical protein
MHYSIFVLILIALLGHSNFRVREKASSALTKYATPFFSYLIAAEHSPDLEMRSRAQAIVNQYYKTNAAKLADLELPINWTKWPCIDMLVDRDDRQDIIWYWWRVAGGATEEHTVNEAPEFRYYREATRLWIVNQVANRVEVREILKGMCKEEIARNRWLNWPLQPEPVWRKK